MFIFPELPPGKDFPEVSQAPRRGTFEDDIPNTCVSPLLLIDASNSTVPTNRRPGTHPAALVGVVVTLIHIIYNNKYNYFILTSSSSFYVVLIY